MELIDVLKQRLVTGKVQGFTKEQVKELKGKSFYGDNPVEGDRLVMIMIYPPKEKMKDINESIKISLLYEKEFERFCKEYDLYDDSESFIKVIKI